MQLNRTVLLVAVLCLNVNVMAEPVPQPAPLEEVGGRLPGYLPRAHLPDSAQLLPAPPANDSPAFAYEQAITKQIHALRDTARWELAVLDADLSFPNAAGTFSCALGVPISEGETPFLYRVLRRTLLDAGLASYAAKNLYQRERPFVANGAPICTPEITDRLATDGSYPSGHTAIGWAWALILAELAPERRNEILARGLAYGDSRKVCNVHWPSDVVQGRNVGAGVVGLLQADPTFRADLAEAKREVAELRANGAPPSRDCDAEAAALAIPVPTY
jgi:acid phosphatase (class A)